MEFNIKNEQIFGLENSIIASGNAMRTELETGVLVMPNEKDLKRASSLGRTKSGEGHDNFLNGIIVQFDLYAPLYMWKQIQRYHFIDFISSQSTMHKLTKFNIETQCVSVTDKIIVDRYQEILNYYNSLEEGEEKKLIWRVLVASLPSGFVLGATMTTNYRQLKTIYNQRKNHKLIEWHQFCEWCEKLPLFKELCLQDDSQEKESNTND